MEQQQSVTNLNQPGNTGLAPKRLFEEDSTSSNIDENGNELPGGLQECYFREGDTVLKPINVGSMRKG